MKYVYLISLFLILTLIVSPKHTHAESLRLYYDWSTTINNNNILGVAAVEPIASSSAGIKVSRFNRYIVGGDLLPNNPLYFLKRVQENVILLSAPNSKEREKYRIVIAGEKVNELQKLVELDNLTDIMTAASLYKDHITTANENIQKLSSEKIDISDMIVFYEKETAKHFVVLENTEAKARDKVKPSIKPAVEANENSIKTVSEIKKEPIISTEAMIRLQALHAQGIIGDAELKTILETKTRTELHQRMRSYVEAGKMPEADFILLYGSVMRLYPEEFTKIRELKKFIELTKLESIRPDDTTLQQIQAFAKTYKPGQSVPVELQKYWIPIIRLDDLQNTIRPDLIDIALFNNNEQTSKKYKEVVEKLKPRPEDIAFIQVLLDKQKIEISKLPPEYQRMYNLAKTYGAQCGADYKWVQSDSLTTGGYCKPSNLQTKPLEISEKLVDCQQEVTSAKSPEGVCVTFSTVCIPQRWTKVKSCTETPSPVNLGSTLKTIQCPSNSHFVPVSYLPDGGYCVPNYSPVSKEEVCPYGYHRNYSGGSCLVDALTATSTSAPIIPLTNTPGEFPSPVYTNTSSSVSPTTVAPTTISASVSPSASSCKKWGEKCGGVNLYSDPRACCIDLGLSCTFRSGVSQDEAKCECSNGKTPGPDGKCPLGTFTQNSTGLAGYSPLSYGTCPVGYTFDGGVCKGYFGEQGGCAAGYTWDSSAGKCLPPSVTPTPTQVSAIGTCPSGYSPYGHSTNICASGGTSGGFSTCPVGYSWNSSNTDCINPNAPTSTSPTTVPPTSAATPTNSVSIPTPTVIPTSVPPTSTPTPAPPPPTATPAPNERPTISITSPSSDSTISGSVTVQVDANDNEGIEKVEIYLEGKLSATLFSKPYETSWNTSTVPNGKRCIDAYAYDKHYYSAITRTCVTVSN